MLETSFSSLISQKSSEVPIFGTFMAKKFTYIRLYFRNFDASHVLLCYCDIICEMFVLVLVCMERGDPYLYHDIQLSCFPVGGVFSNSLEGVATPLFGKIC